MPELADVSGLNPGFGSWVDIPNRPGPDGRHHLVIENNDGDADGYTFSLYWRESAVGDKYGQLVAEYATYDQDVTKMTSVDLNGGQVRINVMGAGTAAVVKLLG